MRRGLAWGGPTPASQRSQRRQQLRKQNSGTKLRVSARSRRWKQSVRAERSATMPSSSSRGTEQSSCSAPFASKSRGTPTSVSSYINSRNLSGMRPHTSSGRAGGRRTKHGLTADWQQEQTSLLKSQSMLLSSSLGSLSVSLNRGSSLSRPSSVLSQRKTRNTSPTNASQLPSAPRIDTGLTPSQLIKSMGGPLRWRPYVDVLR